MTFNDVLKKYRDISFNERDKGNRFERLMQGYLLTDPKYSFLFKSVWLWEEFPSKNDLGGNDLGIDLVAITHEGEYWAIQCKCYQPTSVIEKSSVDSFLSTSSREFRDENQNKTKFSVRLWISTTNNWGVNAEESIRNQSPQVVRIHLTDLQESPIDWEKLENGIHGEQARISSRSLKPHQQQALELTHEHFKTESRGKLIMACGTGKTYTSLRIAEHETKGQGVVLFLVPSIALLGQTLREWTTFSQEPIHPICICSDPEITRKKTKSEEGYGYSVVDLALPASTNVKDIVKQFKSIKKKKTGMTVVFSTYQSIEVISKVQQELKNEIPELESFDLTICDESHRTTGVTLSGEDESAFTKVHDDEFLKSKKRIYMTATPRLYSDETKSKAAQNEALLCSMDDEKIYGQEIYRIGFGEAVEKDLLTDYKVLILTLSDKDIPPAVQKMIADKESEINTDDASKLIGCINALSKQVLGDNGLIKESDPEPMRRAVAFCQNISASKKISSTFNTVTDSYISSLPQEKHGQIVSIESKHIDGTMSAPYRDEMLGWLKGSTQDQECRVLTNVKVLSEGVDVPSLDAVLFLSARNSQVDVVQSVGRVMRKSPGKKYGYIIIPVVVPSTVDASSALDDNERYKVVWTVLNALRAHDDRFNATVNKIELNKKRPDNILVGRPEYGFGDDGQPYQVSEGDVPYQTHKDIASQLSLQFEQLQDVVFARMVEKVGDRRYWEQWAKNVAEIAERQMERITRLIKDEGKHQKAFEKFLGGLRKNINPSISEHEAVEMLSQHIITKPVFDALFEGYSFVNHNPISVSMQKMLDLLEEQSLDKDTETLEKFYESVKMRAQGIDNSEGKQKIIVELYDKFFKTAFPKMVEKLGIVYTPVECVDFVIHSVNDVLKKEFGRGLTDENIHCLDPFTGTGTFITRLLQSGIVEEKDLERKYKFELHANEIVLLAYYIAAINIENAYHDQTPDPDDGIGKSKYTPFDGIVLTDTFQLGETDDSEKLFSEMFPQNSKRVERQKKSPLRVIFGNPPYSVGQKSTNDNAQNQSYLKLDNRISNSYGKLSSSTNMNALYDSYIKSFRWSTDRLDKNGGVICFITNGAWIDGNSTDGFRKSLEKEFTSIYVFNLRGNQRTSGELSRKEGGKIFGSGSRTPITITLLVKNPEVILDKAVIHYHDIGDYLSREEKLEIIKSFKSIDNTEIPWKILHPNEHGDWISQRNESFDKFIPIEPIKKFNSTSKSFFTLNSLGSTTNRDAWSYSSSSKKVKVNITRLIEFYNQQVDSYIKLSSSNSKIDINEFIDRNPLKISWTSSLIPKVERKIYVQFEEERILNSLYRPFYKQKLYFGEHLVHRRGQFEEFFPKPYSQQNLVIFISGVGVSGDFSCLISNCITDGQILQNGQCFPLYYYEKSNNTQKNMFDDEYDNNYVRRDGVADFILEQSRKQYGAKNITKEDIFYYVYGFLHSPDYRDTFSNDLKKILPRLPLVDDVRDFWSFSKSGRELAELHLNYEQVPRYNGVKVIGEDSGFFKVEKMRFPKKDQKDTIIYNSKILIQDIPLEAYEYMVNGKSAIEWVMERYQITTHKESQITNDPNDWSEEVGNPRYILDLLLSVINVSVQTVEIVKDLPKLKFD
jgi:predicted helicase